MTLTEEDIGAIKTALQPEFLRLDQKIDDLKHEVDDLKHDCNKRFIAIEVRLDSIEYKLGQIGVFVPFENAYKLPPMKKN